MVFSADGKRFATGCNDTSILIWDTDYFLGLRRAVGKLTSDELAETWITLKEDDAEKAYRAMERLIAVPVQATHMLRDRMRPTPALDESRTLRLIALLSSSDYTVRHRATAELEQIGEPAWTILEAKMKYGPTVETRRRIEWLLKESPTAAADYLRELRAIEVLERIASEEALQVLQSVAKGCPTMRRTREAKASLARLSK